MQPLPSTTVEHIFARLTVRWGVEFLRQYEGVPIAAVKEDWARELAGFVVLDAEQKPSAPAIQHALANLPERACNVAGFRALCRTYLAPAPRTLSRKPQPVPAAVAEYMARLQSGTSKNKEPERVRIARRYVERHGSRTDLNPYQRQTLTEYQRVLELHARFQQSSVAAAEEHAHG